MNRPRVEGEFHTNIGWADTASLSTPTDRADFITHHAEIVRREVVASLSSLVPQLVNSDTKRALEIAEVATMLADRLGDAESTALSSRAKANALYALRQNDNAIEHHRKAERLFRSLGQSEQVARTLSSSLQPLILQGRYKEAFAGVREARRIFTERGNRWRLARLDLNLGNLLDRQDRFAESLQCYERAYAYLSQLDPEDPQGTAVALHNMAVAYVSLNNFRKAEEIYNKARDFAEQHNMPVLVGQTDYNVAWLHYLRGNYGRAISMLREARDSCESTGDQYHVALCHLDLSEIYLELNLVAEASEEAEQAEVGFGTLGMQYERAKAITNLAVAGGRQSNSARSLDLFQQAHQIFLGESNKIFPYVIDLHRARVLFGDMRNKEARELCDEALRGFIGFKIPRQAIVCRLLLARLHLRGNNVGSAQEQCTRALRGLRRAELPDLSCQAYTIRGQLHAAAGRNRNAYAAYQQARHHLESLRSHIGGEEFTISFMKDRVEIYQALVDLCIKREENSQGVAEIFDYIEQAKSRTLFDFLSSSSRPSSLAPKTGSEHAKRFWEVREELNWYLHRTEEAQLNGVPRQKIVSLQSESQLRERELLSLSREHSGVDDHITGPGLSRVLTLAQVMQSLDPAIVIAEYFQVRGQVIVLLLGCSQARIVCLGEVSDVSALIELLELQLSKFRLDGAYVATFAKSLLKATQSHLKGLYEILVAPIRKFVGAHHLVVAPHGALHGLPFHALYDGERYLVDDMTVSYSASASIHMMCQGRHAQTDDRSLILGISDPKLPFLREEVEAVAGCLPHPELLLGEKATIQRLQQEGPGSRFIHIATHGYFRRDNPMFSGIRLGDAYLTLYDLNQMELPAELITLSGCSTGLNLVTGGDELLGLARGLTRAGAESCLLTLWDVQDQSTAGLMKLFYKSLAAGCGKAVALQRAMVTMKSERPHPYYWAPFVLVGKV